MTFESKWYLNHFIIVHDTEKFSMMVNNKIYPTVIQVRENSLVKEGKSENETNSSILHYLSIFRDIAKML